MQMFTVGELARRAGVPVHRVTYVIETRGIAPIGRAGQARVFSQEAAEQVLEELQQINRLRPQIAEQSGSACV
jgi:DNA-binding transcriptional MerR regulator